MHNYITLQKNDFITSVFKTFNPGVTTFVIHPLIRQYVETCKERYLAVALSLWTSELDVERSRWTDGHANVLIFDTVEKTIDRYDPHGPHCNGSVCPLYNQDKIDKILKEEFKKIIPGYKFIDFSIACPNIGPQHSEVFDRVGYCVTWSLMFTVLRILNPGKTPNQINTKLLEGETMWDVYSRMLRFAKFYTDILKNSPKQIF